MMFLIKTSDVSGSILILQGVYYEHWKPNFISSIKLSQKHTLYSNDLYGSMLFVFVRCIPVDPISLPSPGLDFRHLP